MDVFRNICLGIAVNRWLVIMCFVRVLLYALSGLLHLYSQALEKTSDKSAACPAVDAVRMVAVELVERLLRTRRSRRKSWMSSPKAPS